MTLCTVEGCNKQHNAKGLCAMHYQRVVRRGTTAEPPRPTPDERFWRKVNKTESCWEWTGSRDQHGYGGLVKGGRGYRAHRVSYEMLVGPIPEGMYIDHICHNPPCVNPQHLRLATQKQNMENRRGPQSNNKTGALGVSYLKSRQQYIADVAHNGKRERVGYFSTFEDAKAAVIRRRLELFTHNDADRQQQGG